MNWVIYIVQLMGLVFACYFFVPGAMVSYDLYVRERKPWYVALAWFLAGYLLFCVVFVPVLIVINWNTGYRP